MKSINHTADSSCANVSRAADAAGSGDIVARAVLTKKFMEELLDSVECLTALAEEHGVRTLVDLMYLKQAILAGGFIDHYSEESSVREVVQALPSGSTWSAYIHVEQ